MGVSQNIGWIIIRKINMKKGWLARKEDSSYCAARSSSPFWPRHSWFSRTQRWIAWFLLQGRDERRRSQQVDWQSVWALDGAWRCWLSPRRPWLVKGLCQSLDRQSLLVPSARWAMSDPTAAPSHRLGTAINDPDAEDAMQMNSSCRCILILVDWSHRFQ
jgi:hypothetical protein